MTSPKQIAANRANAKKSTGPSEKGKAKSRLNAIRDNLTGQIITLSATDRVFFEKLKAEHVAALAPIGLEEFKFAQAIAWDTWRLDHLRAIEMNVYALGLEESMAESMAENMDGSMEEAAADAESNPPSPDELDTALADAHTFRAEAKRFELMSLYEQRMNRSLHRNVTLFRALQAERKRSYERDKEEEVLIARLHEFNEIPIQASTRLSRNGFIFSNEEIAIGAVRQRYIETALDHFKTTKPRNLFGALHIGCGDSHLRKVVDGRPLSADEYQQIHSVPPEVRAVDRLNNPDAYGVRQ
jgi:hypothetical protein